MFALQALGAAGHLVDEGARAGYYSLLGVNFSICLLYVIQSTRTELHAYLE